MNIIWKPNPLTSIVEVNNSDKERMLLAYKEDRYSSLLISIEYGIKGKYNQPKWTLEKVETEAEKWRKIYEMDIDDPWIASCIDNLASSHIGDCTCVACSCMKCWGESLLGISTIQGLGSHEAEKIWGAFVKEGAEYYSGEWHDDIDLALKNLSEPISETPNEHYEGKEDLWKSCIPRWESERKNAYNWLKAYKEKHAFGNTELDGAAYVARLKATL